MALADFQSVPELAGNPFIKRIFQLFDADQDGCLNFEEFIRAVESFGRLYSSEDKCMCEWLSQVLQHQLFNLALPVSYNMSAPFACRQLPLQILCLHNACYP